VDNSQKHNTNTLSVVEELEDSRYCLHVDLTSLLAIALSMASLAVSLVMFVTRERKADDAADIRAKLRALELESADVVDRLSTWQRRDAARQRRMGGAAPDEQGGLFPDQHAGRASTVNGVDKKASLRSAARARGLMS